jgi:hypothetical protein
LGRTIIIKSPSATLFQKIGKNNNSNVFISQTLKRLGRTIILKSSSARLFQKIGKNNNYKVSISQALSKDWEEQ